MPLLLLSRPTADSQSFLRALGVPETADVPVLIAPVIEIVASVSMPPVPPDAEIILTSRHGLIGSESLEGRICHVVGQQVAEAAREAGGKIGKQARTAAMLAESVKSDPPRRGLIWLRGARVAHELGDYLTAAGIGVEERIVYQQQARAFSDGETAQILSADRIVAPVFSAVSTVFLCKAWPLMAPPPNLVAISAQAANAWTGEFADCIVAETPDRSGMTAALREYFPSIRVVAPKTGD